MQHSFFNTIQLSAPELVAEEEKAKAQEQLVESIFQFVDAPMTPFDVQRILLVKKGKDFPITSIRRAITVLTKKGKLNKCNVFKKGDYGTKNHLWVINRNN